MTKRIDQLVADICGATSHPLAPLLRRWCAESRQFIDFVEAHASKIRKKARLALRDDELADLTAELAIAAFLARERRFAVLYEPPRRAGTRGPDLQVTFRTQHLFHVEVTRLRLAGLSEGDRAGAALKLARVVCDKIDQFPPGAANLLAAVVPPDLASDALAPAAIRLLDSTLQPAAHPHASELRLDGVRDYVRLRQRLSAIALCSFSPAWQLQSVKLWQNPPAKHPLQPEVTRYLAQMP